MNIFHFVAAQRGAPGYVRIPPQRAIKDRPLPLSPGMVRAALRRLDPKTQTRRVVLLPKGIGTWEPTVVGGPTAAFADGTPAPARPAIWNPRTGKVMVCPYGQTGDRLWGREAWRAPKDMDGLSPTRIGEKCLDAGYLKPWSPIEYEADAHRVNWDNTCGEPGRSRRGMHMPRWASRLDFEITGVRLEPVQNISVEDALAEGIDHRTMNCPRVEFAQLWNSLNDLRGYGWDANPWVWAIDFRRIVPCR
jgi:hypothetical protein